MLQSMGLQRVGHDLETEKQQFHCERVTGRKARGLQTEEVGCKRQTGFLSLLSSRRKQTSVILFPLLDTNLKRGFS